MTYLDVLRWHIARRLRERELAQPRTYCPVCGCTNIRWAGCTHPYHQPLREQ